MRVPNAPFLAVLLLLISTAQCTMMSNPIQTRSIDQARRLRATPYGYGPAQQGGGGEGTQIKPSLPESACKFPALANKGGPPDMTGIWNGTNYITIDVPSGFASTSYLGGNEFMQQTGRFLSWECTGDEGTYRAIALRQDTFSNGTVIVACRCEIGKVWLGEDSRFVWVASTEECPDPKTVDLDTPSRRVPSKSLPQPDKLVCTAGANVRGMDTYGRAGLDPLTPLGTTTSSTAFPPPLEQASYPPTFSNSGGPKDLTGIWLHDKGIGAELTNDVGFSSVELLPDDTFLTMLGRWNSYECEEGPGEYRASLSYTLSPQAGEKINNAECTVGKVDLVRGKYSYKDPDTQECPKRSEKDTATLTRIAESPEFSPPMTASC